MFRPSPAPAAIAVDAATGTLTAHWLRTTLITVVCIVRLVLTATTTTATATAGFIASTAAPRLARSSPAMALWLVGRG